MASPDPTSTGVQTHVESLKLASNIFVDINYFN